MQMDISMDTSKHRLHTDNGTDKGMDRDMDMDRGMVMDMEIKGTLVPAMTWKKYHKMQTEFSWQRVCDLCN